MAVKPFQLLLSDNKKEEKRIFVPREVEGIMWAELKSNIGGQYGFKEESFNLKISFATGLVTASHKWLLGSLDSYEDVFEILHRKYGGKDDRGYAKWEPNPEEAQIKERWSDDGSLVAILCDGIPQLEMLAEFATNKLIYKDDGYTVYPGKNPDKALFKEISQEIADKCDSSFASSRINKSHKEFLKDNSWFFLLNTEEDVEATESDALGSTFSLEFEDGLLTKVSVKWTEPEVKDEKRSWSGGGGQKEKDRISDRVAACLELFKADSLDEISEKYEVSPFALKMSLVLGSTWTLPLNDSYKGSKENLETKPETAKPKKETPIVSKTEENGHVEEEEFNPYLAKILELKEERAFPKAVDPEHLKEKGTKWCEAFLTVLNGRINEGVPFSKEKSDSRKVASFLNLKWKKALNDFTLQELQALMAETEFEFAESVV